MRNLLVTLSLVTAVALPRYAGAAPPDSRGATAAVEIRETSPGGKRTEARFEAAVALDRGASVLEAAAGDVRYQVELLWSSDKTRAGEPLLDLDLSQQRHRQPSTKLRVRAALARGKRTVVGHVTRPDGGTMEVAITLR
jgi:hypothetical protein